MSLIPRFCGGRRRYVFDPLALDDWECFKDFAFPSSWALYLGRQTFAYACPRMYWKETQEARVFTVNIPGVKKEEVKVGIDKDERILKISGGRIVEKELNGSSGHRVVRSCGRFMWRCRLPEDAELDQVKASKKNATFTITVPKMDRKKSDVIFVDISV